MTIRRQYSLPNCTLILEGLSTSQSTGGGRPPLTVLIRFECHLAGLRKPLVGGRNLIEHLAVAVSQFAQEFLSGIRRPAQTSFNGQVTSVQLQRVDLNTSRLVVPPDLLLNPTAGATSPDTDSVPSAATVEIDLSTVQAFDLVEAFDQLLSDTQTLPDLSLNFSPLSRKYSTAHPSMVGRSAPAALGVTSLALAAVAFFFIPVPKVEEPQTPTPKETPPARTGPGPALPEGGRQESPQERSSSAVFASAPGPDQLAELKQKLYSQIARAWQTQPRFYEDLPYQVGVDRNGRITGYRPVNQAAVDYTHDIPLLELLEVPEPGYSGQKPLALFRVVFTPGGDLKVSPWSG